jgi:hypothetical protein
MVRLNNGEEFPPSGIHLRRTVKEREAIIGLPFPANRVTFDPIVLPDYDPNIFYIVSTIVFDSCPDRVDLIVPDTSHPNTTFDLGGKIVSVPTFKVRI